MLRVFIALGKQLPKNKAMIEDTEEVAKLLAKYNCTMVQGGAKTGLMGAVVSEFQKYSDEVVMIVPEVHKSDLEGTKSKEHYIVEGESDRLKITINTCDMIVVLPGGTGTLAELAFYNETCKSGEHNAKIVMVNTKGFYNKLFKFCNHQVKNGFMKKEHFMFEVINNAKQLEPIIQQLITEKQAKLNVEQVSKEAVVEDAKKVAKVKPLKSSTSKQAKASSKKVTKTSAEPKQAKVETKNNQASTKKATADKKVENVKKEVKTKTSVTKKVATKKPVANKSTINKSAKTTTKKTDPTKSKSSTKTVKPEVNTSKVKDSKKTTSKVVKSKDDKKQTTTKKVVSKK